MKERPVLFSAPMVRAILAGTKTQTRRMLKPQPAWNVPGGMTIMQSMDGLYRPFISSGKYAGPCTTPEWKCPYGDVGGRLWVKETLRFDPDRGWFYDAGPHGDGVMTDAEWDAVNGQLERCDFAFSRPVCPSIYMPRKASRVILEITGVRVERLQEISKADCYAEGIRDEDIGIGLANAAYLGLWDQINGKGSAAINPWVWVIEFQLLEQSKT